MICGQYGRAALLLLCVCFVCNQGIWGKAVSGSTSPKAAKTVRSKEPNAGVTTTTSTPIARLAKKPVKASETRTTTTLFVAKSMAAKTPPKLVTTTLVSPTRPAAGKSTAVKSPGSISRKAGKAVPKADLESALETSATSGAGYSRTPAREHDSVSKLLHPTNTTSSFELGDLSIRSILVNELFLGSDPLENLDGQSSQLNPLDASMTHVSEKDIDMVLEFALQPVNFWLELGAFEGGSAILTAKRIERKAAEADMVPSAVVLTVDTFLGDTRVLWGAPPLERRQLLRPDGTVTLFERFRANVQQSGYAGGILPLPATSIVALRVVAGLVGRGIVPPPQVIYLDSAHEEGEVLLELEVAWKVLPVGGIMFGDDWALPPVDLHVAGGHVDGNMVRHDVLRFAEMYESELDDTLGPQVQPMRTLGRARPGLFVSYQSFQWFVRRGSDGNSVRSKSSKSTGFDCWSGGFDATDCCDTERYGQGGKAECWDLVFTFEQCCQA